MIEPENKIEIRRVKDIESSSKSKEEPWSRILGRREKKKAKEESQNIARDKGTPGGKKSSQTVRRTPRTAAIQISCRNGAMYTDVLREAKEKIDIDELGISDIRPRRARTGALLLEIPGTDGSEKANKLANKLKEALQNNCNVLISRPEKMADIRVRDLVDSTTKEELISKCAEIGKCDKNNVRVSDIVQSLNGLGSAIVKCTLAAAKLITKSTRIRIGWTSVRVDLLPERPPQCFKCLEVGHVRAQCRSEVDRGSLCYRCEGMGHAAKGCINPVNCVVCLSKGRKADHRMGGPACGMKTGKGTPAPRDRSRIDLGLTSTPKPLEENLEMPSISRDNMQAGETRDRNVNRIRTEDKLTPPDTLKMIEVASTHPNIGGLELMDLDDTVPKEWSLDGEKWTHEELEVKEQRERMDITKNYDQ
ncbi:hypothetical protein ALC60_02142 [Trachymyrmex zeteki]|uniref:CCHC-type domain-containing protein n=1 Tax=Mycetomoellerius zeteki TaxID=64791 RepID=A0A151XEN5_9HYME|nr:hypothetical protein ALC60_02142 [Trachymyrmex zeteki]